ncbi:TRAP transporter large permease [Chloroflexota bacterium]
MDPFSLGITGMVAMLLLLVSGVHIVVVLGAVGLVGLIMLVGLEPAIYTSSTLAFTKISAYGRVLLPLFILMGMLAQAGGQSDNIYNTLRLWVGKVRGGLAIATVGACTAFGTVCGSSLVTATVFAQVSAPEMRRQGYEKKFAYAVSTASGMIGMLIPPSVMIVVYAELVEESVGALLVTGAVPGVMLFIIFSLGIIIMTSLKPSLAPAIKTETTWRQKFTSLKSLWGVVTAVGIIFGGIFGGVFSPTEAGAIAAVVLLVLFLFSKQRSWQALKSSLLGTVSTAGMIFLIIVTAGIFSRFLVLSTVVPRFMEFILSIDFSPLVFLVILSVIYLILGLFLEGIAMLALTLPFLHPAALAIGINNLQFAMVAIIALEAGLITPPVGLNVYVVKGVAEPDVSLEELFTGVAPFFFMVLSCLILFILFPPLSTFLASLMID